MPSVLSCATGTASRTRRRCSPPCPMRCRCCSTRGSAGPRSSDCRRMLPQRPTTTRRHSSRRRCARFPVPVPTQTNSPRPFDCSQQRSVRSSSPAVASTTRVPRQRLRPSPRPTASRWSRLSPASRHCSPITRGMSGRSGSRVLTQRMPHAQKPTSSLPWEPDCRISRLAPGQCSVRRPRSSPSMRRATTPSSMWPPRSSAMRARVSQRCLPGSAIGARRVSGRYGAASCAQNSRPLSMPGAPMMASFR